MSAVGSPWIAEASLLVVGALLAFVSSLLHGCFNDIRLLRSNLDDADNSEVQPTMYLGHRLPSFRAEALDSSSPVTDSDLRGSVSLIVFLDAAAIGALLPAALESVANHMLRSIDGSFLVVCRSRQECRELRSRLCFHDSFWSRVKLLADSEGSLRRALGNPAPWTSLIVGTDARIQKVGSALFIDGPTPALSHSQ